MRLNANSEVAGEFSVRLPQVVVFLSNPSLKVQQLLMTIVQGAEGTPDILQEKPDKPEATVIEPKLI